MQNLEHLITKKIKSTYLRRLSSPIIYLIFLAIVWFYTPMHALMHPLEVGQSDDLTVLAQNDNRYINVELGNLSFTGYTLNRFGFCQGYYYYTMRDDQCYLVILSPRTCEEGLPSIEKIKVRARLESAPQTYEQLAEKLAEDLGWTKQGLTKQVSHYIISEPGFGTLTSSLLLFVYFVSGGYALISIVLFLIYAFVPVLSPTCNTATACHRGYVYHGAFLYCFCQQRRCGHSDQGDHMDLQAFYAAQDFVVSLQYLLYAAHYRK